MDISKLDQKIKPSGTMAISNKSRELKSQGKPVIGFGAGEPDFPSPDYVVDAAINCIQWWKAINTHCIFIYIRPWR